jgi:hypothetical protein
MLEAPVEDGDRSFSKHFDIGQRGGAPRQLALRPQILHKNLKSGVKARLKNGREKA